MRGGGGSHSLGTRGSAGGWLLPQGLCTDRPLNTKAETPWSSEQQSTATCPT